MNPLKYPGDGELGQEDLAHATVAAMHEAASFNWHKWALGHSTRQCGDMLALLAWKLRCEASNNVELGKLLQQAYERAS